MLIINQTSSSLNINVLSIIYNLVYNFIIFYKKMT